MKVNYRNTIWQNCHIERIWKYTMKKIIDDLKKLGVDLEQENPFEKEIPDSFKIYGYKDLEGEDNDKSQDD